MPTPSDAHNVGDVVEVVTACRVDGVLTNPTTAKVWVTSPDLVTIDTEADATLVTIGIGDADADDELVALVLTEDELTAWNGGAGVTTGILRTLFVATMEGPHGIHIETDGAAQGADDLTVDVAHPAANRGTFDGTATVA